MAELNSVQEVKLNKNKPSIRNTVKVSVPSKFMQQLNTNKPITASHKINTLPLQSHKSISQQSVPSVYDTPASNKLYTSSNTKHNTPLQSHSNDAVVTTPPFITQTPDISRHNIISTNVSPAIPNTTTQFVIHSATTQIQPNLVNTDINDDSTDSKVFPSLDQLKHSASVQPVKHITPRRSTVEILPSHSNQKLLSPAQQRVLSARRNSMTSPNALKLDNINSKAAPAINSIRSSTNNNNNNNNKIHIRASSVSNLSNNGDVSNTPISFPALNHSVSSSNSIEPIDSQPLLSRQLSNKQHMKQSDEQLNKLKTILLQQAYINTTSQHQYQQRQHIALHQYNDVYNQITVLNNTNATLKLSLHRHQLVQQLSNVISVYEPIIPNLTSDIQLAAQYYNELMCGVVISLSRLPIRNMNHTVQYDKIIKYMNGIVHTLQSIQKVLQQHHITIHQLCMNTSLIHNNIQQHNQQLYELSNILQQMIQLNDTECNTIWTRIDSMKHQQLQYHTSDIQYNNHNGSDKESNLYQLSHIPSILNHTFSQ